ncbi:ribosomal protein S18-alanine N-acetyltransferase [Bifidobacterium criceti]|uniref:Alanine acetyltransferase n=1 Tax=Bifidobacterium criceti TaxID=1960969 RepID=A0A2A2EF46_9BIFI|nr:ribosomal protein S18-alanine N-acetyltransferase [Bifidobacterium criceti]PAU67518.1 alanine acetyltransferase [Bifidobacterium criceti]
MIVRGDTVDREMAVAQMGALEQDLFGAGAWSANAVRQELDAPARAYYFDVDDTDGHSVDANTTSPRMRGYAGYWYDGYDAQIMTIGVAKPHQREGIGRALLERMIKDAKDAGAERMLLEVRVDNDAAIALYQSLGFKRMGLRKRYYQPEGVDAYTMSLELAPRVVGFAAPTPHTAEQQ